MGDVYLIQWLALATLVLGGVLFPSALRRVSAVPWRWIGRLSRRRALSVLTVGSLAFGLAAILSVTRGIPEPKVHDEFSYLLAADTFAHGRLTNPTHPLWEHFETFYVIHTPTYQSKYPPAQGLLLAVGVLAGHPIVGVWLGLGLACGAVCWMLMAWVPPRWAVIGGLLAAFHPFVQVYWGQTYWGGAAAMAGGALAFGALPRVVRKTRIRDGLTLVLGLAILANSRPYEGFLASLPIAAVLAVWLARSRHRRPRGRTVRLVIASTMAFVFAAAATGYYAYRVTGDPFLPADRVYEMQYQMGRHFVFQKPRPEPVYRHDAIRRFHTKWHVNSLTVQKRSAGAFVEACVDKLRVLVRFYVLPAFVPPLLFVPWAPRWRGTRLAAAGCAWVVAGVLPIKVVFPHYLAPIAGSIVLLVVQGLRRLRILRLRGRRPGRSWAVAIVAILLVSLVPVYLSRPVKGWHSDRARVVRQLTGEPGLHLIVVRYGPRHPPVREWVWNRADIDGSKIVWARSMGVDRDRELLDYFSERRAWLLDAADAAHPTPVPYVLSER